jgi:uridine phosphorylase
MIQPLPAVDSSHLLNKDGSVYHLNLKPEHLSDVIISVGDPHRVFKVSQHFNDVDFEMNKGEYITHIGNYKGKRISVISSGTGVNNIEILLNELDFLAESAGTTSEKKSLKIVRVGTSASLQDIPLGSELYSNYSIGLDSLIQFYDYQQDDFEQHVIEELQKSIQINLRPYCARGSQDLKEKFAFDMIEGNSLTSPGFYASQGRRMRVPVKFPNLVDDLCYFHYNNLWLTNFELETAAFYALGRIFGHEVISLNVITENRIKNSFSKDPEEVLQKLILKVLDRI